MNFGLGGENILSSGFDFLEAHSQLFIEAPARARESREGAISLLCLSTDGGVGASHSGEFNARLALAHPVQGPGD